MPSDIRLRDIGVLCRDVGFLPRATEGFDKVEVRFENAYQRKGSDNYATALTGQLRRWHPTWFDEIVIIGDGEGDVRLCKNFINLSHITNSPKQVQGLFLAHQALERFRTDSQNIALYGSWEELSAAFAVLLSSKKSSEASPDRTLVLADIDRTILFPRIDHDDSYSKVRMGGITDYVNGFRLSDSAEILEEELVEFTKHVSNNLPEYTNEFNEACFKNEEVVAIVTLLLSVGTIITKWVQRSNEKPSAHSLRDMVRQSIYRLEHGGWISGFYTDMSSSKRYAAGETIWNCDGLIRHLKSIQENYESSNPVICPEFRLCESARLSNFVADHRAEVFNLPLLDAVRSAAPVPLLFISDRPALSLGFDPDSLDDDLGGGAFWTELRKCLLGDSGTSLSII